MVLETAVLIRPGHVRAPVLFAQVIGPIPADDPQGSCENFEIDRNIAAEHAFALESPEEFPQHLPVRDRIGVHGYGLDRVGELQIIPQEKAVSELNPHGREDPDDIIVRCGPGGRSRSIGFHGIATLLHQNFDQVDFGAKMVPEISFGDPDRVGDLGQGGGTVAIAIEALQALVENPLACVFGGAHGGDRPVGSGPWRSREKSPRVAAPRSNLQF